MGKISVLAQVNGHQWGNSAGSKGRGNVNVIEKLNTKGNYAEIIQGVVFS